MKTMASRDLGIDRLTSSYMQCRSILKIGATLCPWGEHKSPAQKQDKYCKVDALICVDSVCGASVRSLAGRRTPIAHMAAAAPDYSYTAGLVKVLENPRWPIARACQAVEACLDMNKCAAAALALQPQPLQRNRSLRTQRGACVMLLTCCSYGCTDATVRRPRQACALQACPLRFTAHQQGALDTG